jgi:hypothetical protein
MALKDAALAVNAQAVAAVTKDSAIPRLVGKVFHIVSPDYTSANPLHRLENHPLVRHITEVYAEHIGTTTDGVPFTPGGGVITVGVARRRRGIT